jgi:hypothetical protein
VSASRTTTTVVQDLPEAPHGRAHTRATQIKSFVIHLKITHFYLHKPPTHQTTSNDAGHKRPRIRSQPQSINPDQTSPDGHAPLGLRG